jgi:hypothetical protein
VEHNVRDRVRDRWGIAESGIEQASPLEALRIYLERVQTDPLRRDLLVRYAGTLLGSGPGEAPSAPVEAEPVP